MRRAENGGPRRGLDADLVDKGLIDLLELADDLRPRDVGPAIGADRDVRELDVGVAPADRDRLGARDEIRVAADRFDLRTGEAKWCVLVDREVRVGDPDVPDAILRSDEHP